MLRRSVLRQSAALGTQVPCPATPPLVSAARRSVSTCQSPRSGAAPLRKAHPRPDVRPAPANSQISRSLASEAAASSLNQADVEHADVAIVGGGVVGLALACAVANSPTFRSMIPPPKIVLIEGSPLDRLEKWPGPQPQEGIRTPDGTAWENRVISLTADNLQWLDEIGATPHIVASRTRPVQSMHVTDGLTGSGIDFDAPSTSRSPLVSPSEPASLSTMVEISNLQQALLKALRSARAEGGMVQVIGGARVERIEPGLAGSAADGKDPWPVLYVSGREKGIRTRLLVGADGGNSPVRSYAGIEASAKAYGRKGLVATLRVDRNVALAGSMGDPHEWMKRAHQRFLKTGPIAWLPLSDSTASMVWTLPTELAEALTAVHRDTCAQAGSDGEGSSPVLSQLVTAAFRLPWASISHLFTLIQQQLAKRGGADRQDWSWLGSELATLLDPNVSRDLPDHAAGHDIPPPVVSIDERSVASFPLRMSHAEVYLGSSLSESEGSFLGFDVGSATDPTTASLRSAVRSIGTALGHQFRNGAHPADGGETTRGRGRTALIGDAAHTIHPLAGQGLNLGVADAKSLFDALERAVKDGVDLGSHTALEAYPAERYRANAAMLQGVDALHHLFSVKSPVALESGGADAQAIAASLGISPRTSPAGEQGRIEFEDDDSLEGVHGARPQGLKGHAEDLFARGLVWARSTGMEVLNELGPIKEGISRHAGSGARERRRQGGQK